MLRLQPWICGALLASASSGFPQGPLPSAQRVQPNLRSRALVISDFEGQAPGVNTPWTQTSELDPGLSFSGWEHGPGTQGFSGLDNALGFFVGAPSTGSDLDQALADGEYLGCSIAGGAAPLDLRGARVQFDIARLQFHAPRRYALFTSAGGFQPGDQLFITPAIESSDFGRKSWSLFLPAAATYAALSLPLEIRLYAFEANYSGHDTSLKAFRLDSNVAHYDLTLGATPGGSAWSDPAGPSFDAGDRVRMHVQPDPGFRFAGWHGDIEGLGNPRTVTMTRPLSVVARFEQVPANGMTVGINLDWANASSTAWPFIDLAQRTRHWWTRGLLLQEEADTGYSSQMQVDANGWPTGLPFDPGNGALQFAHTEVTVLNEPGAYTFHYRGMGSLRFTHDGGSGVLLPTPGGPQSYSFVAAPGATVSVELLATAPEPDHLRDFHLVHDLYATSNERFHPLFLQRLEDFNPLRFMDWGETNSSTVVTWDDRTRPEHYSQARPTGVAWEIVIELCEELNVDAWICVPHRADDDYVRQLARLFRDELDPELRVHVEYSNETWNASPAFDQGVYVRTRGLALGLDTDPTIAGHRFTAKRAAEIWHLFAEEFGASADRRVVNVLATHLAGFLATERRIAAIHDPELNPHGAFPQVLAIAPYFGHSFGPAEIPPQAPGYPTLDGLLDGIAPQDIAALRASVAAHKALANDQGYRLVGYEGGQHFSASGSAQQDPVIVQRLHDANRDPRMGMRYLEFLDMLKEEGLESFTNYSFCRGYSEYGSWAVLEHIDQPALQAPKYQAILNWIAAQ